MLLVKLMSISAGGDLLEYYERQNRREKLFTVVYLDSWRQVLPKSQAVALVQVRYTVLTAQQQWVSSEQQSLAASTIHSGPRQ